MNFTYDIIEAGWARAEFKTDSKVLSYEPNYINDPYGDLLRSMCGFLREEKGQDAPNHSEIKLNLMPLLVSVRLEYLGSELRITITEYDETERVVKKSTVFDETVDTCVFVEDLIECGREMLAKYGMAGYRANSINFEFPFSSFIALIRLSGGPAMQNACAEKPVPASGRIYDELGILGSILKKTSVEV